MCKLALSDLVPDDFPVKVSDYETKNGFSPTYFLLCNLSKDYPDCEFFFAVGSDLIKSIPYWKEGQKLLEEFKFIIIARPNYNYDDLDAIFKNYFVLTVLIGGSSTVIRKKIKQLLENQEKVTEKQITFSLSGLTTKNVVSYMMKNNLYGIPDFEA